MATPKVFLALPHYGHVELGAVQAAFLASCTAEVRIYPSRDSRLPYNFNKLWCEALNTRQSEGWTHVAMLHSDVMPEPGWLDVLLEEQRQSGVQVLSCIIPIKDERGLTSTALYLQGSPGVRRLTMTDVMSAPETFQGTDWRGGALLVNTGCWLCDFTQPWVERVSFRFVDEIVRTDDGRFEPRSMPEDWHFSLQLAQLGVSVAATRKVKLGHIGPYEYRNDAAWGTWQTDQGGR